MMFQDKVLNLCRRIPKGRITTYALIAKKLNSKAYRAVGTALKNNKIPVVIPCHRVVKSDGTLGGYAGKMNNKKKKILLEKEEIRIKDNRIVDFEKKIFRF
ncbi:MGMT family protein [Candidatus Woesearchaeota archaeon]|nr:MGMT family protein [Candidatus Woesearchaeota archaeon]